MTMVTLEEAKANLGELLEKAAKGEPFIVTDQGGAHLEVAARLKRDTKPRRLGGLEGQLAVPDDFDSIMRDEIEEMFYGPAE